MTFNNDKHVELITDELNYHTNEFEKLLKKQAAKMFVENELYICRYQGYDDARGNIIVEFEHRICYPPRKNETLHCFVSSFQDENVKRWGGLTYETLRTNVTTQFDSKTIFFKYEKDRTIVGLSGVKVEDVSKFEKNAVVFLAPSDPPLNYLINLVDFLHSAKTNTNKFLNLDISKPNWNPTPLIIDDSIVSKIQTDLIETDTLIIQGPPGTGKTYLMSQLCAALLNSDYKILVTSLTNRALIELAEKKYLKSALEQGKVFKSALTADESKNKKTKGLQSFKSISKQKPPLLLSTYYVMSQLATKAVEDDYFDYIIIEEASQALLSTIAMAKKIGKKCIIIGDIMQLEPIFHKEIPPEDSNHYQIMVCGLKAVSFYLPDSKQYILTDSHRLTENSVRSTNFFYNGLLKSISDIKLPIDFSSFSILKNHLNSIGGPSILKLNLPNGILPSADCVNFIISLIDQIKQFNPAAEISVIAFHRNSIRSLQKEIYSRCNNTEDVLVETIDRIQGLTTDFCIYFVPAESFPFSLQLNRFNVATSRARLCTLIITDENMGSFLSYIDESVKQYLLSIADPLGGGNYNNETEEKVGPKIIGKIDLSPFEKPKKEIREGQDNIYIIDTNVFIDYPDIVKKIDRKYKIVLSAKVIDELDTLKSTLSAEQTINIQKALRSINNAIDNQRVFMDTADLTLLPSDFNKKSSDNFILAVALKFKDENPIMLTSDNGLQIKAKGLGLTTITLREFIKQLR